MAVKPIPDGFTSLTPHIVLKNAAEMIEFYKKAFGATEMGRMEMPGTSNIMHAQLKIGNAILMLCDEFPGQTDVAAPCTLKGSPCVLHIYTTDVDADYARAVAAGAKPKMPPMDMFWGDRYSQVVDPCGHVWSIATHKRDLTPDQIVQEQTEFFANRPKGDCGSSS